MDFFSSESKLIFLLTSFPLLSLLSSFLVFLFLLFPPKPLPAFLFPLDTSLFLPPSYYSLTSTLPWCYLSFFCPFQYYDLSFICVPLPFFVHNFPMTLLLFLLQFMTLPIFFLTHLMILSLFLLLPLDISPLLLPHDIALLFPIIPLSSFYNHMILCLFFRLPFVIAPLPSILSHHCFFSLYSLHFTVPLPSTSSVTVLLLSLITAPFPSTESF